MTEHCDLAAVEARRLIGRKELSPVELLESCLKRIERTNGPVNAIVAMDVEGARRQAKVVEQAQRRGEELGLLAGLPIAVKDLQATAGLTTTWGSLLFKGYVPAEDDHGVACIRRAGGVIWERQIRPSLGQAATQPIGCTGRRAIHLIQTRHAVDRQVALRQR